MAIAYQHLSNTFLWHTNISLHLLKHFPLVLDIQTITCDVLCAFQHEVQTQLKWIIKKGVAWIVAQLWKKVFIITWLHNYVLTLQDCNPCTVDIRVICLSANCSLLELHPFSCGIILQHYSTYQIIGLGYTKVKFIGNILPMYAFLFLRSTAVQR